LLLDCTHLNHFPFFLKKNPPKPPLKLPTSIIEKNIFGSPKMDDVVDKPAVLALQLYEIAGYISNNLPCLPVELAKTNTNTGEALLEA